MDKSDIKKLFAIFQARYGHKWAGPLSDADIMKIALSEWLHGLERFPLQWVRTGLNNWVDDWPPSLPEFQAACLPPPEQAGLDVRAEAIRRAAGDSYNLKRMPAAQANKALSVATAAVMDEYKRAMINNPALDSPALLAITGNKRAIVQGTNDAIKRLSIAVKRGLEI